MVDLHGVSKEQKHYLQHEKRNQYLVQFLRNPSAAFSYFYGKAQPGSVIIDSFIFSSPSQIITVMKDMILDGSLIKHVSVTLTETFFSFILVTALGIVIAVFLWAFPKLSAVLEPYLVVLNSLPKLSLPPSPRF